MTATPVPGSTPAIAVEHVSKRYRDWRLFRRRRDAARSGTAALTDVSFAIGQGETVGLLGPNGAGKTTLLKIIATLLYVSSGRVLIHGRDVQDDPLAARRLIGLVTSDERSFYWRLTGRQNLTFFAALYRLPSRSIADRVAMLLEVTRLADAADRPFHTYSSGMKQRLAIARGFLADPRIVLYDEPTRSLDPLSAFHIREWIAASHTHSPNTTHLIATNQLREAEELCGRVLIINRGTAIASGTITQIREQWRRHDYIVHRITYRGPALDGPWNHARDCGLIEIQEGSRDGRARTLRVTAVDGSEALSPVLAAILTAGGTVVQCATEQVPFDEVFCGLVTAVADTTNTEAECSLRT
jgi:ABC-2 type transport system ATP-binding protein